MLIVNNHHYIIKYLIKEGIHFYTIDVQEYLHDIAKMKINKAEHIF